MASKTSPNTSTFIDEGQSTKPQTSHGNPDVAITSAHSYVVPKYVTDVATLIATTPESRKMFLTEVTRVCLEAAKKYKAEADQAIASQMVQTPTTSLELKQFTVHYLMEIQLLNLLHQCTIHQVQA